MLNKPRAVVDAAWAAYRELGTERQWRWTVTEIREQYGYNKDALYRDFDKCGYTERRETLRTRRKRKALAPPCPGVGRYCVFCDLMPFCTDWHCQECDRTEMCPCYQPKSAEWTAKWEQYKAQTQVENALFERYGIPMTEDEYAD